MTEHQQRRDPAPEGDARPPERDRSRPMPRPGVWVADHPGALVGWWHEAHGTTEEVAARIAGRLILDTVDFDGFTVRPDERPETVAAVANGIRQHGLAFAAWAEFHDADPAMLTSFAEHYLGHYDDPASMHGAIQRVREADRQTANETELLFLDAPKGGTYLFAGPEHENP
ncbi:hypothetical protein EK0264_04145 [Epidermidibacterium keratini]|uniref:Antirestriction protein ArdA n=1 Tax=Epidermidibacterium keratini TaxID=1891644 RepID=A0A7L4YK12_9ACTN|nr:hypothetical protein [Epidermidibacterium keratini]QHB99555.1 hypothetical protein EK0264_04145 [Epidermidibacterium keratini]